MSTIPILTSLIQKRHNKKHPTLTFKLNTGMLTYKAADSSIRDARLVFAQFI